MTAIEMIVREYSVFEMFMIESTILHGCHSNRKGEYIDETFFPKCLDLALAIETMVKKYRTGNLMEVLLKRKKTRMREFPE